jgi:hypothetical protein
MNNAQTVRFTPRAPDKTFDEMLLAIADSLSDLESSDNRHNWEDEDDLIEQGKLREHDKPGWVMGTITHTAQQSMQMLQQMQMTLDELTQPGWEDAAD